MKGLLFTAAMLLLLAMPPGAWTQAPMGLVPTGPTLGASLRNAAAATRSKASIVRRGAVDWGRRASSASYRVDNLHQDYNNTFWQFQALREQFNALGALALQLNRPQANNAVTELDAGLNIISELFAFLDSQYNAGTLDRNTVVRTCRAFDDALQEWERELNKSSTRMGLIW